MREPPAAVQGTRRGRAMSQLQFWLHFAALNKVTLRAARSLPPRGPPLPAGSEPAGAAGTGARSTGPGAPPTAASAFPDLDSFWGARDRAGRVRSDVGSQRPGRNGPSLCPSSGSPGIQEGVQPLPGASRTQPVSRGRFWGSSGAEQPQVPQGRPRVGSGVGAILSCPPGLFWSRGHCWQPHQIQPGLCLLRDSNHSR